MTPNNITTTVKPSHRKLCPLLLHGTKLHYDIPCSPRRQLSAPPPPPPPSSTKSDWSLAISRSCGNNVPCPPGHVVVGLSATVRDAIREYAPPRPAPLIGVGGFFSLWSSHRLDGDFLRKWTTPVVLLFSLLLPYGLALAQTQISTSGVYIQTSKVGAFRQSTHA